MEFKIKLSKVLKNEMVKGGWTVEALSVASGVPKSTLSEWRNGRVPKNPIQVRRVSVVLGVEFEVLYFGPAP